MLKLPYLFLKATYLLILKYQMKLSRRFPKYGYSLIIGVALLSIGISNVLKEESTAPQKQAIAETVGGECPAHLPNGLPGGTSPKNALVVRTEYCLSSNPETKFADWVAFRLDRASLSGSSNQNREWKPDPAIAPSGTLEPEDYAGAYDSGGYDRGHLAPLASFRGQNWETVNYLSNIVPQKSAFNRGAWKELEDYERDLVNQYGEVFTIVGTAYDPGDRQSLPNADEPNNIPDYLWRIMVYDGKIEAYIFPQNTPAGTDFKMGQTTVNEVEQWSGFRFNLKDTEVYAEPL